MSAEAFSQFIAFLEASKYFLLFAGSYIEGSAVMMAGGILWRLGTVQFWPMYAALVLGDILADIMWYAIGYFGARPFIARWGHWIGVTTDMIGKVERRFHKHHTWILIISKLTMGFGLAVATLVTAGLTRVSFVRYFIIQLLGGFVWVLFLVMIGYYFGNVLAEIPRQMQIILGAAIVLGFFFGLKYLNNKLSTTDW